MSAEGSLSERHSLVLEKRYFFLLGVRRRQPAGASHPGFQGFSRPNNGQGRKLVKKDDVLKVLRMGVREVENLSGLQESIFRLFRSPQLHFGQK